MTGVIEQRGGKPLISMLPDVFEWPIAMDDWDTKFGIWLCSFHVYIIFHFSQHHRSWICFFHVCHALPLGDKWRAEDAIAKLNEKYGKQVLISFFIGTDDRDSNSHIIHVSVHFQLLFFSLSFYLSCYPFVFGFFLCSLFLVFIWTFQSFPIQVIFSFFFLVFSPIPYWQLSLSARHCLFKQREPLCSYGHEPKTHNRKISMNK